MKGSASIPAISTVRTGPRVALKTSDPFVTVHKASPAETALYIEIVRETAVRNWPNVSQIPAKMELPASQIRAARSVYVLLDTRAPGVV